MSGLVSPEGCNQDIGQVCVIWSPDHGWRICSWVHLGGCWQEALASWVSPKASVLTTWFLSEWVIKETDYRSLRAFNDLVSDKASLLLAFYWSLSPPLTQRGKELYNGMDIGIPTGHHLKCWYHWIHIFRRLELSKHIPEVTRDLDSLNFFFFKASENSKLNIKTSIFRCITMLTGKEEAK